MSLFLPGTDTLFESGLDNLIQHIRTNSVVAGCQVIAHVGPDMGVRVGAGTIQAIGIQLAVAQTDLVVAANVSGNPRLDLVHVDMTTAVPAIVAGAPAATPKPPPLPAGSIELGIVGVANNAVNIQAANIGDRRLIQQTNAGFGRVLSGNGTAAAPSFTFWNNSNIGMFNLGGAVAFAVSGTEYLRIVAGAVYLVAGAALAPIADQNSDLGTASFRWHSAYVGTAVQVGTNPASAGLVQIGNNAGGVQARNAANTGNIPVVDVDGANVIQIAAFGAPVTISGNTAFPVSFVTFGANPAQSGMIRIANNSPIKYRNAANNGDLTSVNVDGANNLTLGDAVNQIWLQAGAGTVDFRYAVTALGGGAAPTLGTIGGTGPAVAAQNSWLKILINGTASFLPVWR